MTTAPIIVTAIFAPADFAWLDGERRAYFPPGRNQVPAHLTLFHHLPPSIEPELRDRLASEVRAPAPQATVQRLRLLGGGVAYDVDSRELAAIRARLSEAFRGLLTPQDAAGWRGHVTIQNKVPPADAKALHAQLAESFRPRPLAITGLAAWWYRGGPWEPIQDWRFRG